MEWEWQTGQLGWLPATEAPLSADVGLVRTEGGVWIFDVGSTPEAAAAINGLPGKKRVVLSHFHPDHTGNLSRVEYDQLYAGAFTCKKIGSGTAVTQELFLPDGVRVFPIPSAHAKGCLGLEYDGYAFLGDAVYPAVKGPGKLVYNVSLLAQQIQVLSALKAERFLISHKKPFVHPKAAVLAWLKGIYARRRPGETYLLMDAEY